MLVASVAGLAKPWPLTIIVDTVLGGKPPPLWTSPVLAQLGRAETLYVAVAAMVLVLLSAQTLALAQTYASQLLGQRLVLKLRCDLYAKLQYMSLKFHDNRNVGDLIYRITGDASGLKDIVTYGFLPTIINLATLAMVAAAIFAMDTRLAVVAIVAVPLLFANTVFFATRVKRSSRGLARADSSLYTKVSEVLGSIRAVKAFGAERLELERFASDARESQKAYVKIMTLSTLGSLANDTLSGLIAAAVVLTGAMIVMGGSLTLGELLVFIAYLGSLQAAAAGIAQAIILIHRSYGSAERVVDILEQVDERAEGGRVRPERVEGRVTFDAVDFAYDGVEGAERGPALIGLDLDIAPGEKVALVGRSGAGKTTLLSLLMGFYRPQQGVVRLDGADIRTLDLAWLRRNVALVLQDAITFSASIQENIRYGRPDATSAEIEAAAAAAGLDEFVASLPDGYDTKVGERGARLSGGQRQRIGIARAFLKDAPILILDEPTSNLDAATERQIFEALERLARGRTTLIVAHRLSTAQRADRIAVLQGGRLIEQGVHDDLVALDGVYAGLWRDQGGRAPRLAVVG